MDDGAPLDDGGSATGQFGRPIGPASSPSLAASQRRDGQGQSKAPSEGGVSFKILLAVIPALIALGGTIYVGVDAMRATREGKAAAIKASLLDDTSLLKTNLRNVRGFLVNGGYDKAQPAMLTYAAARDHWSNEEAKLRLQIQEIYGSATANLVYDRASRNFIVDMCGVVVARTDPARGTNCTARLHHEVKTLTARQDAANDGKAYSLAGSLVAVPADFTTDVRLADSVLEMVNACKAPGPDVPPATPLTTVATPVAASPTDDATASETPANPGPASPVAVAARPLKPRCANLKYLQYALNLRVNIVGLAQETLADAITAP